MSEEVQRLALDTARAVADRLGEMFQRFRREGPEGADGEERRVDRTDPAFRRLEGAAERAFDACLRLLGSVDELAAPLLARGLSGLSRSEGGADSLILPQAGPAGRSS